MLVETLAAMLNKTTSLLPSNLFASLGMPKTEESISEAKHVRPFPLCLEEDLLKQR